MCSKRTIAGLAVATALLVAGCGSSQRSAAGSAALPGPIKLYKVALAGSTEVPAGAPAGRGVAVVAFHGTKLVCFRFAHLHGFTIATAANLYAGAAGKPGHVVLTMSPGPRMHHQGCLTIANTLMNSIERAPQNYYVSILSQQYSKGAVRGQL